MSPPAEALPELYPVFLDLRGRTAVVVGGGAVAEEKVADLLRAGARVTIIAEDPLPGLVDLGQTGEVELRRRAYRAGDLAGAFLVLAERSKEEGEAQLFAEAEARGIFANVQDRLSRCSFQAPARFRRGRLCIAISTAGAAPALAARVRLRLADHWGEETGRFLELVHPYRKCLAASVPCFEERRRRWYRLVDSDVLDLLRRGDEAAAIERIDEILGVTTGRTRP